MSEGISLSGVAVSVGIALGPAWVVDRGGLSVPTRRIEPDAVPAELERLARAIERAHDDLVDALAATARLPAGPLRDILEAHRQLTRDDALRGRVEVRIRTELLAAESALVQVMAEFSRSLASAEGSHLRELAHDVEQITGHLLDALRGDTEPLQPPAGAVLVVRDLPPREAVRMREHGVIGLVTTRGSATSHTALLARALGIPAVVGVRDALRAIETGALVEVDGFAGVCHVHPSHEEQLRARARASRFHAFLRTLAERAAEPLATLDGEAVDLRANIELPGEGPLLAARGAAGVGLFRTEYLFLASPELPSEAAQTEAYSALLRDVAPFPVTFRTFDLGADKLPDSPSWRAFEGARVPNPALAPRGLRLALENTDLFRAQLRAVARASAAAASGTVELLFPMVTSRRDLLRALALFQAERAALEAEGLALPPIAVGAMIEVPAAVLMVDVLLPHVDFVAIGTNDLLQYSLAVDRADPASAHWARPCDPALLRAIRYVLDEARVAGKPVRVCGDAAADPIALPILLGLGARQLSVPSPALPLTAATIRRLDSRPLRELASAALRLGDAEDVEQLVIARLRDALSDLWGEQGYCPTET